MECNRTNSVFEFIMSRTIEQMKLNAVGIGDCGNILWWKRKTLIVQGDFDKNY